MADCGAYAYAIESETQALSSAQNIIAIKNKIVCGCYELGILKDLNSLDKDCKEIIAEIDKLKSQINQKNKISVSELSFQGQVTINGVCVSDLSFISITKSDLDPLKHIVEKDGININNGIKLYISDTENRESKVEALRAYLYDGVEEEEVEEEQVEEEQDTESGEEKLKIKYGFDVDKSVVSNSNFELLFKILKNAKINRTITVTSTKRDPIDQVRAMITNIKNLGIQSQLDLYSSKGDILINYYSTIKNKSLHEIEQLMLSKKKAINFLSAHEDWEVKKGAFDLGKNSNGFGTTYANEISPILNSAKSDPKVNPTQVFPPRKGEAALHIEIKLN